MICPVAGIETSTDGKDRGLNELTIAHESTTGRWMKLALKFLAIVLVASWIADLAWFYVRLSFPASGRASGSVHRVRLLAISDKGNKTEYQVDAVTPEEDVPCANSIFPHGGENPCWYVIKHAKDPIPM